MMQQLLIIYTRIDRNGAGKTRVEPKEGEYRTPKCRDDEDKMKVFEKDGNVVIWGDALEAMQSLVPDCSIDLIFADPPYNIGKNFNGRRDRWPSDEAYIAWCYEWLNICLLKLNDKGILYVMTATQNMPYFDLYLRKKIHILSRIVWSYDSSGVQAKRFYGSLYEPILFCVKDKDNYTFNADDILVEARTGAVRKLIDYRKPVPSVYNDKKVPGNVWAIPRVRYRMAEYENHPTQKPVALLERIIKASSNPGDIVLDPFSGTFTTSFVAQSLGRRSIGIEIDEEYMKIGLRRLHLCEHYNGKALGRQLKSYERCESLAQQLVLFER
jgi:adenine-specific DNA-methyltransferase